LARWRLAARRPSDATLVFPGRDGEAWSEAAYQSWRRRAFARAARAAGVEDATPYALRHSFASLLLHEGRSVIYHNPHGQAGFEEMELAGLEPATSWVRSRRSSN
jgi:integrase